MLPHHGFLCKHCHFLVLSQPTDLRPLHSDSQHPLLQAPPSACCSTPTRSTCICASTTILCCHTLTSSACSCASPAVLGSVAAHQLAVAASQFTASARAPIMHPDLQHPLPHEHHLMHVAALQLVAPASARAQQFCLLPQSTFQHPHLREHNHFMFPHLDFLCLLLCQHRRFGFCRSPPTCSHCILIYSTRFPTSTTLCTSPRSDL